MGGGGKGGGVGGNQISATPDPAISAFTEEVRAGTKPIRDTVFAQISEALRTGGVGARLPIVQKGNEASRSATSAALRSFDEATAGTGTERSPLTAAARGQISLAGEQRTAGIPVEAARELTQIAPNVALGSASTIIQGLTNAAGIGTQQAIGGEQIAAQRDIAKGNQQAAIISGIFSAVGGAAGGAAACWIAAVLYGEGSMEFYAARSWIFHQWRGPVAACTRITYRIIGRPVAWIARRSPLVQSWLRPWFDRAVACAGRA